ncbi:cupin domain-containing protein [Hymenobacter monticola]|uniref:Cupin domain-containing protein n=1 Tax=Hymenobacter monticola TaxID=1705399 RepID=A0ABY4BFG2_9BACT|nr:cupin domain-containing protein [Hymenobacter monticola]UOE36508.1 cupin domain-containing protein [Hymenobacter monticola]
MRPTAINLFPAPTGPALSIAGGTYRIITSGAQTNGAYAVIDMLVPPGSGPGPHAHPDVQELFYVLEGEVVFRSDTQTTTAGPGALAEIPKGGAVHNFTNESDAVAHLLCVVVPAGLDQFFVEIGQPVALGTFLPRQAPSPEALQKLQTIGREYGQEFFSPDYFTR